MPISQIQSPVIPQGMPQSRQAGASSPQVSAIAEREVVLALASVIAPWLQAAEQAQSHQVGAGHGGPQLAAPAVSADAARETLAGLQPRLGEALQRALGSHDPISTEANATRQASEGAASQQGSARLSAADAARDDAAIGPGEGASSGGNRWLVDSPMTTLLVMLRELLIKLEALDRKEGMRNIERSRHMTEMAGQKGIQKAEQNLGGAIGGALVTGAVGAAGLKQSMKSTGMQVRSAKNNLQAGNKVNAATQRSEGMVKTTISERSAVNASSQSTTHVSSSTRSPQVANDGAQVAAGGAAGSEARLEVSQTQHESLSSETSRTMQMTEVAQSQPQAGEAAAAMAAHTELMARAQVPASQAMLLNMMAQSAGNTIVAGVGISAEMTEAQRLMAQHASDTFQKIADNEKEQGARVRESRQAAADVAQTLIRMAADTSHGIVGRM